MPQQSPARSTFFLVISRIYFMVTIYAAYWFLTRLLSPGEFGLCATVLAILSAINQVMVAGASQSISRHISTHPEESRRILHHANRYQLILGMGATMALFFAARPLAWFCHDPALAPYWQLAAPIPALYALLAVTYGAVNGRQQFGRQVLLDIVVATSRVALVLLTAWLLRDAFGPLLGLGLGAVLAYLVSLPLAGRGDPQALPFPPRSILKLTLSLMLLTALTNCAMEMDTLFIKRFSPADSSNLQVAFYTAALTISRAPHLVIMAIAVVIFPMLTRLHAQKQEELFVKNLRRAMYFAVLTALAVALPIATSGRNILGFIYPAVYAQGAAAAAVLTVGYFCYCVATLGITVYTAVGKPGVAAWGTVCIILVNYLANSILISRFGLLGGAAGTALGFAAGAVFFLIGISRRWGLRLHPGKTLGLLGASAATCLLAAVFPDYPGAFIFVRCTALGLTFVALTAALRLVQPAEFKLLFKN